MFVLRLLLSIFHQLVFSSAVDSDKLGCCLQGRDVWVHTNESTKHWTEVADEPVWVSLAEAQAFCSAHNARIMTEPEYLRLLSQNGTSGQRCGAGCYAGGSTDHASLPLSEVICRFLNRQDCVYMLNQSLHLCSGPG